MGSVSFLSLSPFSSPSPSSPCEDRVRRWPSASQEEGLTKSRTSWHTDGGTSQSPEMWEIKFCWLKHWEELIKSSDGLLQCGHSNAHQGVWVIGVKKRDNLKFNSFLSFTNCVNVSNLMLAPRCSCIIHTFQDHNEVNINWEQAGSCYAMSWISVLWMDHSKLAEETCLLE